jgi:hypothetical protein
MPSKLKPVKRLRKKHHAASTESDSSIVASNLGRQGFGTSFEDKMLELNLQILEEIRTMRQEVTSFVQQHQRRRYLAL